MKDDLRRRISDAQGLPGGPGSDPELARILASDPEAARYAGDLARIDRALIDRALTDRAMGAMTPADDEARFEALAARIDLAIDRGADAALEGDFTGPPVFDDAFAREPGAKERFAAVPAEQVAAVLAVAPVADIAEARSRRRGVLLWGSGLAAAAAVLLGIAVGTATLGSESEVASAPAMQGADWAAPRGGRGSFALEEEAAEAPAIAPAEQRSEPSILGGEAAPQPVAAMPAQPASAAANTPAAEWAAPGPLAERAVGGAGLGRARGPAGVGEEEEEPLATALPPSGLPPGGSDGTALQGGLARRARAAARPAPASADPWRSDPPRSAPPASGGGGGGGSATVGLGDLDARARVQTALSSLESPVRGCLPSGTEPVRVVVVVRPGATRPEAQVFGGRDEQVRACVRRVVEGSSFPASGETLQLARTFAARQGPAMPAPRRMAVDRGL